MSLWLFTIKTILFLEGTKYKNRKKINKPICPTQRKARWMHGKPSEKATVCVCQTLIELKSLLLKMHPKKHSILTAKFKMLNARHAKENKSCSWAVENEKFSQNFCSLLLDNHEPSWCESFFLNWAYNCTCWSSSDALQPYCISGQGTETATGTQLSWESKLSLCKCSNMNFILGSQLHTYLDCGLL